MNSGNDEIIEFSLEEKSVLSKFMLGLINQERPDAPDIFLERLNSMIKKFLYDSKIWEVEEMKIFNSFLSDFSFNYLPKYINEYVGDAYDKYNEQKFSKNDIQAMAKLFPKFETKRKIIEDGCIKIAEQTPINKDKLEENIKKYTILKQFNTKEIERLEKECDDLREENSQLDDLREENSQLDDFSNPESVSFYENNLKLIDQFEKKCNDLKKQNREANEYLSEFTGALDALLNPLELTKIETLN